MLLDTPLCATQTHLLSSVPLALLNVCCFPPVQNAEQQERQIHSNSSTDNGVIYVKLAQGYTAEQAAEALDLDLYEVIPNMPGPSCV
jgi:hypothetical protein